jgi:hypothetical protein
VIEKGLASSYLIPTKLIPSLCLLGLLHPRWLLVKAKPMGPVSYVLFKGTFFLPRNNSKFFSYRLNYYVQFHGGFSRHANVSSLPLDFRLDGNNRFLWFIIATAFATPLLCLGLFGLNIIIR